MNALSVTVAVGSTPTGADFSHDTWWIWAIKAVAILVVMLLSVLFAIWFERRVVGRMQVRPGPNVHGPFGLLQSLADAMKLLVKEDIDVTAADKIVYLVAPMIAVFCSLLTYAVIPMGPQVSMFGHSTPLQLTDFPVATLYILACASVGVYGIVLGGWSSASTYPLLGSVRSTAQVISYELAMGLSLVSVFVLAGSMSTSQFSLSPRSSSSRRSSFTLTVFGTSMMISIVKTGEPMNGADSRRVDSSSTLIWCSRRYDVMRWTMPG